MTLGMLTDDQARALAGAGLDYYNHNIDTGPDYSGRVITRRSLNDRLDTLEHVREAGIALCCGGIMGMGETREDRIGFFHVLANLPLEYPVMFLQTRITDLLGIRYPIIQGGMQNVGYARLAAAVSNAGGLGMITALTFPDPQVLAREIALCRSLTETPFGVNISVFPTMRPPDYRAIVDSIADAGIDIVETAGTPAVREVWDLLFARGIKIIHKCTSVRHALSSERYGVHAVSIDGFECAGHPGEDDVPALVLIPSAVDQLKVPVIASGGIADGRGLVAALALGAEGVTMGTRFCATKESPIHDRVKKAYVDNSERDTDLLFRPFRNTARVGRNAVSQEVLRRTAEPSATFADVADLVSGARGKALLQSGEIDSGIYWASMAQGLIHDIPTCAELIDRMVADARSIIGQRLTGMIGA